MWFAASALIAVNREIQGNRSWRRACAGCRTALNALEIKGLSAWGSGKLPCRKSYRPFGDCLRAGA